MWRLQLAACDCMLGKIGYGTVSECLAHGTPMVFVRRDYFNEEPFLRRLLQLNNCAVEIKRRDFQVINQYLFELILGPISLA